MGTKSLLVASKSLLGALVLLSAASAFLVSDQAEPRLAEASPPAFFEEDFSGDALDPARWEAHTNGYPAPAISVVDGYVQMGQPGASSLDFPYVTTAVNPFPSDGSFELEIAIQYTGLTVSGTGLKILDSLNRESLSIWADSGSTDGLTIRLSAPDGSSTALHLDESLLGSHIFAVRFSGTSALLLVDGVEVGSISPVGRPSRMWFGHPTVGQVNSTHPACPSCDPVTGKVLSRWWGGPKPWTTFRIDYIRVTAIDTDSDGCTNEQELAPDPLLGGGRDPKSFWDYFDTPDPNASPQRDRMIRVGDIMRVVYRYRTNDDDGTAEITRNSDPLSTPPKTGYHPAYDRGGQVGPNPWDQAPPDGMIRIGDIMAVVYQYGHDCTA